MIFFKLIQQIVYPSVFILCFFLIGLLLYKKRFGKILLILSIIIYYLFSITLVADKIIKPLEAKYPEISKQDIEKTQTVVLLLGGKEGSQIRASEVLRLNNLFKDPLKVIISGSRPLQPNIQVGQKVKNFLIQRGLDSKNIILEDKSRTTYESAQIVSKILKQKSFYLVTSSYHMPRSVYLFKNFKTNPIPAPADFKIEQEYDLMDFFPKANNLEKTDIAFHEYVGLLYYKLFKF